MPPGNSLTTLGTAGGPMQNPDRAQPAFLVMNGDRPVLIDCGDGAVGQLVRAGVQFADLAEVFLTHHPLDPVGGLFALLGVTMMTMRRAPPVIRGPAGTAAIVEGLLAACDGPPRIGFGVPGQTLPHPRGFVRVHEIAPGEALALGAMRVTACENTHYRPESAFGTEGPVSPSYRFDLPGRSVVVTGDTGPCRALEGLARGADPLVCERFDLALTMQRVRAPNPQMPAARLDRIRQHLEHHHLSPEQVGDLVARAGVAQVVAVHFPPGVATPATAPAHAARIGARIGGRIGGRVDIGADLAVW